MAKVIYHDLGLICKLPSLSFNMIPGKFNTSLKHLRVKTTRRFFKFSLFSLDFRFRALSYQFRYLDGVC